MPKGQFDRGTDSKFVRAIRKSQADHKLTKEHQEKSCWHFKMALSNGARRLRVSSGGERKRWQIKVNGTWVWEHRYVMEQTIGRPLVTTEVVHHLNEDPLDNHPDNLIILSQADHIRKHLEKRQNLRYIEWRDTVGKPGYSTVEQAAEVHSVILKGVTTILEENETDLVVAHFVAEDGGLMDVLAIPKKNVLKLKKVSSL